MKPEEIIDLLVEAIEALEGAQRVLCDVTVPDGDKRLWAVDACIGRSLTLIDQAIEKTSDS